MVIHIPVHPGIQEGNIRAELSQEHVLGKDTRYKDKLKSLENGDCGEVLHHNVI